MLAADAAMGLLLCGLGIFGVMANLVTERTHEIGIRFALGANRSAVLAMLLRRSLMVYGLGLLAGSVLALQVGNLLASLLEGVRGSESGILLAATATVALISLLASYLPARRAAAVSPGEALRIE